MKKYSEALKKHLACLLILIFGLFCGTAMADAPQGGQNLPYSYGFEDHNLATDGWVLQGATDAGTGFVTVADGDGYSYYFRFWYNEQNAYLLSPVLNSGANYVAVSFWYRAASFSNPEKFQVGYTTDENVTDASSFIYDDPVETTSSSWQEYRNVFPAETRRIAVKYVYNKGQYLLLDNFTFKTTSYPMPKNVAVSNISTNRAVVSWISDASAWNLQYRKSGEEQWTKIEGISQGLEYTIDGLTNGTTYEVQVQAVYGDEVSAWTNFVSFTTKPCDKVCYINIELTDSRGNGWGGGKLEAVEYSTNKVLGSYTLKSGGNASYTLTVCPGCKIQFVYTPPQSYASENGWHITDNRGYVIDDYAGCDAGCGLGGSWFSYTPVGCATFPEPENVTVSNVSMNSAVVSWTSDASSWNLRYRRRGEEQWTTIEGINQVPEYTIIGLTKGSTYEVQVAVDDGAINYWGIPVSFKTPAPPVELPYSYGFENYDLAADGWVLQGATKENTGISNNAAHTGTYGFTFNYAEQNAYLLSPVLVRGTKDVAVFFWHRSRSSPEKFQVGYSTDETVTDASLFTYGDVVTASTSWQEYENIFPAGTKRIAIKYVYTNAYYLFLDDFTFDVFSYPKPENVSVSNISTNSAVVRWTSEASAWNLRYRKSGEEQWTTIEGINLGPEYTIGELTNVTRYEVQVQAVHDNEVSFWTSTVSFVTQMELPYSYGFENNDLAANGWELQGATGCIHNYSSGARTGSYFCTIYDNSYLLSPVLASSAKGVAVSFWYSVYSDSKIARFQVGYTTNENETDASNFIYGDTVEARSPSWLKYKDEFPVGTRRIAIKYIKYVVAFDDFAFDWYSNPMPKNVAVSNIDLNSAVVSWTSEASTWNLRYRKSGEEQWTTIEGINQDPEYTIDGLTNGTRYEVQVQAVYGDEISDWTSTVSFVTAVKLPYSYGFENNDLAADGWEQQGGSTTYSKITNTSSRIRTGSYAFIFWYTEENAYLLSPVLKSGANGVNVSFWYKVNSSNVTKQFQVGYSTEANVTDASSFIYGDPVETSLTKSWQEYENVFPAGTRRIAIRYTSNNQENLLLDDFTFEHFPKPKNIAVSNVSTNSVVVSWTSEASTWNLRYRKSGEEQWTTIEGINQGPEYTIGELTNGTRYEVQVQAVHGDEISNWTSTISFVALPYYYGFENNDLAADGWELQGTTKCIDNDDVDWTGSYGCGLPSYAYLLSPVLASGTKSVAVSFWHTGYSSSDPGKFRVGYTTNENETDAKNFIYGDPVENETSLSAWRKYQGEFPVGTKRIAIKSIGTSVYLDDITIEAFSYPRPENVAVSNVSANSAVVSWTSDASAWNLRYRKFSPSQWATMEGWTTIEGINQGPEYTIEGLTNGTRYEVQVQAVNNDDVSLWSYDVFFTTKRPLQDAWIQAIADETYTGEPLTPDIVVNNGMTTLSAETHYTVSYSNNTNVGQATVTITAKEGSDYIGSATATFNIVPIVVDGSGAVKILRDQDGTRVVIDGEYSGDECMYFEENIDVNSVVFSRTFTKDVYSTMVLPFSVKTENVSGLNAVLYYNGIGKDANNNDAIRMKVLWAADGVINDDKGIPVHYKDTVMKANTPYLVLMNSETFAVEGPVTIVPTADAVTKYDEWEWEFRGVWKYKKWDTGDRELGYAYGFAASAPENSKIKVGDFVKIGEGTYIYPLRAYLVSSNIPESTPPVQGVRANGAYAKRPTVAQKELPELMSVIVDDEGDGKQTTVIGHFNTRTGEFKMNNDATKRTFDVKGRNVGNKANKARGAYYGKKTTARHPER